MYMCSQRYLVCSRLIKTQPKDIEFEAWKGPCWDSRKKYGMALKKVEPNVWKIEDHRRKYERLRKHKEEKRAELRKQEAAEAQWNLNGEEGELY
ncbi:hypothetical protein Ahy_A10g049315 [Arachis hypogaea]|uniref:Uncharacterized protein n=1 Tax=Arachis hypogaea TaxID=3818 RepID=A0A445B6W2_ARAHY|nr:hypothetical protein Ahy_A10g049315 [Arachis hypogaea]